MYISNVNKVSYVAVIADGQRYQVWADGDIERPVWYDGYRVYELMDRTDKRYEELINATKEHFGKEYFGVKE